MSLETDETENLPADSPPPKTSTARTLGRRLVALDSRLDYIGWTFLHNRFFPGMTRRLGGPMGAYKLRLSGAWAYVLATVSWLLLMLRQMPCREVVPGYPPDRLGAMCYTDITALYFSRGMSKGGVPYVDVAWEYPVLTGYFARIANWLTGLLGAQFDPDISWAQQLANGNIYFAISAVGLFICLLWLISSQLKIAPQSPGLAMLVAASPAIWTTGLINWDLLVVALTAAGLTSWLKEKPVWAGLWWGLAVAAKLYPIVIVGALIVLCLRKGAWRTSVARNWVMTAGTAVVVWVLANLPVMLTHFDGWKHFYTMNYADRRADLGSVWYAITLTETPVDNAPLLSRATMIVLYMGLALLIWRVRKAPSAQQIAFLAVTIFVCGNLVYSPQYVLWVVPLLILVRPKPLELTVFTIAELFYFVAIWKLLHEDNLTIGTGIIPWVYVVSVFFRLAVTLWIMGMVVRDVIVAPPDDDKRSHSSGPAHLAAEQKAPADCDTSPSEGTW